MFKNEKAEPIKDSVPKIKEIEPLIVLDFDKDKDGILDSLDICPDEFGLAEFVG